MPYATSDGVRIYYETRGDPSAWPIALLQGGGTQLIGWREGFCDLLIDRGFHPILIDNRDVGLSQRFGGPEDTDGGYELADLAADVVAVLDHAGIERAHVAGQSMGGMMAQVLGLDHPDRVRSLTIIFAIPGQDPAYLGPLHAGPEVMTGVAPRLSREDMIEQTVTLSRVLQGSAFTWDEAWAREHAARHHDRGYAPDGLPRQYAALLRAPDRIERLPEVVAPTLVVHGRDDPILDWRASVDIARAIPDAELRIYPGMGHDIVPELWSDLVDAMTRTARRWEDAHPPADP